MNRETHTRLTIIGALLLCLGCRGNSPLENRPSAQESALSDKGSERSQEIKNVILYIGDGMGPGAMGLLNAYAKYAESSIYKPERKTALEEAMSLGTVGLVYHDAADNLVTDSAASATQMASGRRALQEAVGVDDKGQPVRTLLDRAQAAGKSVGLVSDTRLTHATPAAFAAVVPHRSQENEIAVQLLDKKIDVMLSGGLRHFLPKAPTALPAEQQQRLVSRYGEASLPQSRRTDDRNLAAAAEKAGYTVAYSRKELVAAEKSTRLLGLFTPSGMPHRIDLHNNPNPDIPTLKEMTASALAALSRNRTGFFLLVESGIIDWAAHENDAGSLLHEMVRFDETLKVLLDFTASRNDTLLLVTADHDTGGFGFSYTNHKIPLPKPYPGTHYPQAEYAPSANFGTADVLDALYAQKSSFGTLFGRLDAATEGATPERKAAALIRLAKETMGVALSTEQAFGVLGIHASEEPLDAFYMYKEADRSCNLARATAAARNITWSTGSHTSIPVVLIAVGPEETTSRFGGFHHTTEWSKRAGELF